MENEQQVPAFTFADIEDAQIVIKVKGQHHVLQAKPQPGEVVARSLRLLCVDLLLRSHNVVIVPQKPVTSKPVSKPTLMQVHTKLKKRK